MKTLFICIILFFTSMSVVAKENSVSGALFKKNGKWNVFVESDEASFKKGVLTLIKIPKAYKKLLIEKFFVEITGHQEKCDSLQVCFAVQKIKPAIYDPLKNKR